MGIKEEITKIAVEQGYEGAKPKSIAQAIDALADTLAGEDVTGSRSISGAVKALAPYIGSGGGGSLGTMTFVGVMGTNEASIFASTTPYDITSGESDVGYSIYNDTNVFSVNNSNGVSMPSGCYVAVQATVPTNWTTDSLAVSDANGEQQITSGFECRMVSETSYANAFFTMQVPATGLTVNFSSGER